MACNRDKIDFGHVLVTNGVIVTDTEAVYGIRPCAWRRLPCEGVALLKIRQEVPAAGAELPVAIAVPNSSTVSSVGTTSCCETFTNITLLNVLNETFDGDDMINNTERLVYFNKIKGIIRILDCCTPDDAA